MPAIGRGLVQICVGPVYRIVRSFSVCGRNLKLKGIENTQHLIRDGLRINIGTRPAKIIDTWERTQAKKHRTNYEIGRYPEAMKKLLLSSFVAIGLTLAYSSAANVINVLGSGDFPAKDISNITGNSGLGADNVLAWLLAEIKLNHFPAGATTSSDYGGGAIKKGDYLVLHYGAGEGGDPAGGLLALYFDADQASFAVPQIGGGPSGRGGLSFARFFDPPPGDVNPNAVPDAGSTLGLLVVAMVGLTFLVRLQKRSERVA